MFWNSCTEYKNTKKKLMYNKLFENSKILRKNSIISLSLTIYAKNAIFKHIILKKQTIRKLDGKSEKKLKLGTLSANFTSFFVFERFVQRI